MPGLGEKMREENTSSLFILEKRECDAVRAISVVKLSTDIRTVKDMSEMFILIRNKHIINVLCVEFRCPERAI